MNIMQMTKRIFLLLVVNILVMTTITVVLGLLGAGHYLPQGRLSGLAVFCLVWGFGGAFISLGLSRLMAKWMMGVQVIDPSQARGDSAELVAMVHRLAAAAGVKSKAEECPPADAERHTGYKVGGISPFATRRVLPVFVDELALCHDRIFVNGGSHGLLVELAPADLVEALQATVASLAVD